MDGASATASDAAWANWFEEPTTKVSKTYRGFKLRRRATRGSLLVRWLGRRGMRFRRRGLTCRYKRDLDAVPLDLGHGFADDSGVVLGQPVTEEIVRNPHREFVVGLTN